MASLMPKGAWDTHIHVLDPEQHPYIVPRYASPAPAPVAQYAALSAGCRNIVVVHASMQGPSRATLLETLGRGPALGLTLRALVGGLDSADAIDSLDDSELDRLHAAGVRGARFYLMAWGQDSAAVAAPARDLASSVARLAARVGRLRWIIDIVCPLVVWAALADFLRGEDLDRRVTVVADHFAGAFPGSEHTEDFATLIQLVQEGRLFVKLSALDRVYQSPISNSSDGNIDSLAPLAKALVGANPDQILYGTDWPHVGPGKPVNGSEEAAQFEPLNNIPDEEHIRKLREWIPDSDTWHKIFVTNPERLFH